MTMCPILGGHKAWGIRSQMQEFLALDLSMNFSLLLCNIHIL